MALGGEPDIDLDAEAKNISYKELALMAKLLTRSGKFNVLSLGGDAMTAQPSPSPSAGEAETGLALYRANATRRVFGINPCCWSKYLSVPFTAPPRISIVFRRRAYT